MYQYKHSEIDITSNTNYVILINYFIKSDRNHIFNEIDFFKIHSKSPNDLFFQLARRSDKKIIANFVFYKDPTNQYLSPINGTFGSVSGSFEVDFDVIQEFVFRTLDFLQSTSSGSILIKMAPSNHDLATFSLLLNLFTRYGFIIKSCDLNYELIVDQRSYIDRIDYSNVKRINKCIKAGFFADIVTEDYYPKVYDVIADNRNRRGYKLSMSYDQLMEMVEKFGNKIVCFGVYSNQDKNLMLAASICIRVSEKVFYVFYWGDVAGFESYSPVAYLASYIYQFAQNNSICILDVGTSTINSQPNLGLIRFKRNLGFVESLKPTLEFIGKVN